MTTFITSSIENVENVNTWSLTSHVRIHSLLLEPHP